MMVEVKLFGPQAALAETSSIPVALERPATCANLRAKLAEIEPRLARSLVHSRLAVNHEFAAEEREVRDGDEVALIGMVAGG